MVLQSVLRTQYYIEIRALIVLTKKDDKRIQKVYKNRFEQKKSYTVELRSKGFHGTGQIFPIDRNSLIANIGKKGK